MGIIGVEEVFEEKQIQGGMRSSRSHVLYFVCISSYLSRRICLRSEDSLNEAMTCMGRVVGVERGRIEKKLKNAVWCSIQSCCKAHDGRLAQK
jgi:hypothetical protein